MALVLQHRMWVIFDGFSANSSLYKNRILLKIKRKKAKNCSDVRAG